MTAFTAHACRTPSCCAIARLGCVKNTQACSLGLARNFRGSRRTVVSRPARLRSPKYISEEGVEQLSRSAGRLRGGRRFRFGDGLFHFDRAVSDQGAQRANCGSNRGNHRTDHSGREREFGDGPPLLLHDDPTNVSFVNELSKLREHLFGRSFELLPERTLHGRSSSTRVWRVLNRRSRYGLVPNAPAS